MARYLFATQPITGHVLPALPIVRALVGRGHEVWWYVGKKFRDRVEAAGARFVPYTHAYDYDDSDYDAAFPGRGQLKGLGQIKFDFINLFVKQISPQHLDLEETLRAFPADVVVGDPSVFAAVTVSERGGPPAATYSITYLGVKSRDTAPAGLGLLPNSSLLGQVRNRLLYFLAANVVFKAVSDEIARQCEIVGVRKRGFEGPVVSPFLVLQPTVPSFEYPRRDLPRQIHYIGALLPDAPASFTPPTWWDEVTNKRRPVVVVTQGTVATDPRELITPTIEALAGEDVLVIAAGVKSVEALGLSRLPDNARVEAFVPFGKLLPLADVYVTNGALVACTTRSPTASQSWRRGPPRTSRKSGTAWPTAGWASI